MTEILVLSLIVVAVTVLPVMLAARALDAGRTGPGAALVAVVLQLALGQGIEAMELGRIAALAASVLGGSLIFAVILDTGIVRGFLISILAAVIAVGSLVVLLAAFGALGALR